MIEFTDEHRAEFLVGGGYVPKLDHISNLNPTELVDWCLENNYGPAYWRYATPEDVVVSPNGMIAVGPCDRARIDQIMLERLTK